MLLLLDAEHSPLAIDNNNKERATPIEPSQSPHDGKLIELTPVAAVGSDAVYTSHYSGKTLQ